MSADFRQVPRVILGLLLLSVLFATPTPVSGQSGVAAPLTLPEALAQTMKNHPELSVYATEIRVREAAALQAGLRPNPILSLEAENVFGSGNFSGTDAAETTMSLSQPIELGSKRTLRRELAMAEAAVAGSDYAQTKADVLAKATENYFAVLTAQERLKLADEMASLAGRILMTVEERIESGKAPATERLRANIQRRELEVARDRAQRNLSAARSALAASMGLDSADFGSVSGELSLLPGLPDPTELESALANSPSASRWAAATESHRRAVTLAMAERVPDLELEIGVRHMRESDDTAMVLGVSIPLPVFSRNQGGIAAARSRQWQANAQERSARQQTRAALVGAWHNLAAARDEAEALANEILPDARMSLEMVEYGYRAGKFGILDVLDAQRTLIEVQGRHLDAFAACHRSEAELNRLLGPDLSKSGIPVSATVASKE